MDYIRITDDNIEKEHICCAMSGKQGVIKKEWLKQRFKEGLVFCRSAERGKCFIEYIPAENAWVPIQADGYFYIDCLWVSGSLKGHGYSNDLLEECIRDAKEQGRKGLCILSSEGRKREFLSDPKYLAYKGFAVADTSVGFSRITKRSSIRQIITDVVETYDEKTVIENYPDGMFAEFSKNYGCDCGITVCGQYDENNVFYPDYYFPFFRGTGITTQESVVIERHADKESFAGACDDLRIGVT